MGLDRVITLQGAIGKQVEALGNRLANPWLLAVPTGARHEAGAEAEAGAKEGAGEGAGVEAGGTEAEDPKGRRVSLPTALQPWAVCSCWVHLHRAVTRTALVLVLTNTNTNTTLEIGIVTAGPAITQR